MAAHDHPVFDADNHYYEALDAFTRHLDPALGTRCVQWCEIDGRRYHVLGGRVSRAVTNPTFDPVALPGAMHDYFRGNPDGKDPLSFLSERESMRPAYRDRDARLATLDDQGLAACWMFPTLGMIYEEPLAARPVRGLRHVPGLQPLGGGGLGLRLPGPHLRRPLPHPGRRRLGRARSWSGPSTRAPAPSSCVRPRPPR